MGREIQRLEPIETGKIRLYTCGPTVYMYSHIGNLRTYVFEDLLRRLLEYAGFEVNHVMNVTDVGHLTDDGDEGEDKMVVGARESGRSVWEIAEHYTKAFFSDTDALNIERPTTTCRATEHIDDMIALIQRLEERGYVYVADGNVYYDTAKFDGYGKLALLDRQELKAGARIAVDPNKRHPSDFVLWFTNSKFKDQVMLWDSPWGRGYPGWHIECSAMSMRYLGETIDIHCGGADHVAVHHTNEIAQSEGATGAAWVKFWMHGEWLVTDAEKMAKSGGNVLTLPALIERGYDPGDYRYFCLTAHYRTQLQFTEEAIAAARVGHQKLRGRIQRLEPEDPIESPMGEASVRYLEEIRNHFANDLGIPQALGTLWTLLRDDSVPDRDKLRVALETDTVFGLDLDHARSGDDVAIPAELVDLIHEREEARKSKNFERADEIRAILDNAGLQIEDTPDGTRWSRR